MDLVDAIKKTALLSSIEPDLDAFWRRLYRWYSKNYHTPLHEVEDLPQEHILLHFFEAKFEELEETDLTLAIKEALETDQDRIKMLKDDEEFEKLAEEEAKEKMSQKSLKQLENLQKISKKLIKPSVKAKIEEIKPLEPEKSISFEEPAFDFEADPITKMQK